MTPTYEHLAEFAQWAASLQPNALKILREHQIKFADLDDPWQKLAFTFYSDLCEINMKVKNLFEDD